MLHGVERIQNDTVSDVDIALSRLSGDQIRRLLLAFRDVGMVPLVFCPYDVTAGSLFLASPDLEEGVQLDMLVDPRGLGKCGIRTEEALRHATVRDSVRVISHLDSWLYQVRKRSLKGDERSLKLLLDHRPATVEEILSRTMEVFSTEQAKLMCRLLSGGTIGSLRRGNFRELRRLAGRVRRPVGLWVHVAGAEAPQWFDAAVDRAERILVRTGRCEIPPWNLFVRLPVPGPCPSVRWRPGIVFSHGSKPWAAAIHVDQNLTEAEALQRLTAAASYRASCHFERWLLSTSR
jgi:hypothetical protein